MGREKKRCPLWASLRHHSPPRLRQASAPPGGHPCPWGTALWVIEHRSPLAERGWVVTSLEAHPLPFGTFEITYCCYFFSL